MPLDKNAVLIRLHQSPQSIFGKSPYLGHSAEEKIFLHIWELEAEVNNGGFERISATAAEITRPRLSHR